MAGFDCPGQAKTRCYPVWIRQRIGDWVNCDKEGGIVFFVLSQPLQRGSAVFVTANKNNDEPEQCLAYFSPTTRSGKSEEGCWLAVPVDADWEKFSIHIKVLTKTKEGAASGITCEFDASVSSQDETHFDCFLLDRVHPGQPDYAFPAISLKQPTRRNLLARLKVPCTKDGTSYGPARLSSRLGSPPELSSQAMPGPPPRLRLIASMEEEAYRIERQTPAGPVGKSAFHADRLFKIPRLALESHNLPERYLVNPDGLRTAITQIPSSQLEMPRDYLIANPKIGDFLVYRPSLGEETLQINTIVKDGQRIQLESRADAGWEIGSVHVFEIGLNYQLVPVDSDLNFDPLFGSNGEEVLPLPGGQQPQTASRDDLADALKSLLAKFFNGMLNHQHLLQTDRPHEGLGALYPHLTIQNIAGAAVSEPSLLLTQLLLGQLVNQAITGTNNDDDRFVPLISSVEAAVNSGGAGIYGRLCSPLLQFACRAPDRAGALDHPPLDTANPPPEHKKPNWPNSGAPDFHESLKQVLTQLALCDDDDVEMWCLVALPDEAGQAFHLAATERLEFLRWLVKNRASVPLGNGRDRGDIPSGDDPFKITRALRKNAVAVEILHLEWHDQAHLTQALERLRPSKGDDPSTLMCVDSAIAVQKHPVSTTAVKAARFLVDEFGQPEVTRALKIYKISPADVLATCEAWLESDTGKQAADRCDGWPQTAKALLHILSHDVSPEVVPGTISADETPAGKPPLEESSEEAGNSSGEAGAAKPSFGKTIAATDLAYAINILNNINSTHDLNSEIKEVLKNGTAAGDGVDPKDSERKTMRAIATSLKEKAQNRLDTVGETLNRTYSNRPSQNPDGPFTQNEIMEMVREHEVFDKSSVPILSAVKNRMSGDLMNNLVMIQGAIEAADEFIKKWSPQNAK